ncbi:MAG: hypothetical protein Ct9H300mP28_03560 [Pseudomonadota bacterium]|nr:MAG: hypothetical protein Ct9H300mP28_03560 [Pseudomonadota bacterium]
MFPHMLKTGSLGQWMMKASSGVQVSIYYASIEDMHRKFVFLNRLSPFLTALFANSPLVEGEPSDIFPIVHTFGITLMIRGQDFKRIFKENSGLKIT